MTNNTSSQAYVEIKTVENTRVRVLKANVGAIEEIPGSARAEGYVKVYVAGFAFNVKMTFDEATQLFYGTC